MPENSRLVLKSSWNIFGRDSPPPANLPLGYTTRPDMPRFNFGNERSIVASIYTRIAIDCAAIDILHCRIDEEKRYLDSINSDLNHCLTVSSNIDQTARAFKQDMVMSMLDEGVVAVVPTDASMNPNRSGSYDIQALRVGKIIEWYPRHVRVQLYNDRKGEKEDVLVPKGFVAIIENPLYSVMNEPNSTMKRLIAKLNLLDYIDRQSGSGRLDLIIQLPYTVRSEMAKQRADSRTAAIEDQLANSKYGIAYADATEKIVQLNRPVENNLMDQIEYLTNMAYAQLGMTDTVLNGTADEATMLNYYNRTIEPIMTAIVEAMRKAYLTKTARSQGQTIMYFRDAFKLVPVQNLADIADKFTRNEILSPNEVRQIIGRKPSDDPNADELRNRNIAESTEEVESKSGDKKEKTSERSKKDSK